MPAGARPRPPDHTVFVQILNSYGPTFWSNTFWFSHDSADTPLTTDLSDWLAGVGAAYVTNLYAFLNVAVELQSLRATYWGAGTDAIDADGSAAGTGVTTGATLPANVAACISWPIASHYKGGHPRTYIGGLDEFCLGTVQLLDATFRANLADGAENFRTDVNATHLAGEGVTLGVVSFVHSNAWRSPPLFRPYLAGASVDPRVDTQRRRLGRV